MKFHRDTLRSIRMMRRGELIVPGGGMQVNHLPSGQYELTAGLGYGSSASPPIPPNPGDLQTQMRKVGTDYNIGISPGVIRTADGTHAPTVSGTALGALTLWWSDNFPEGTNFTRYIYLKIFIDDTDPYQVDLDSVEVHLRTSHPAPVFVASTHQWVHIGSAYLIGAAAVAQSHISGSLWTLRMGGPGCPLAIYVP